MLSQGQLKLAFHYDPETGAFTRLKGKGCGRIASTKDSDGYIQISISCVLFLAHRLAWLYMTGIWPDFEIDHRNQVRHDNRWTNLRVADRVLNTHNRSKPSAKNTTGLLGVSRHHKGFQARITAGGKQRTLGTYATAELAHAAYVAAKRELHPGSTI